MRTQALRKDIGGNPWLRRIKRSIVGNFRTTQAAPQDLRIHARENVGGHTWTIKTQSDKRLKPELEFTYIQKQPQSASFQRKHGPRKAIRGQPPYYIKPEPKQDQDRTWELRRTIP